MTMLKSLLSRLTAPVPEPLDEEDSRLALAVLMVRIARSDHEYLQVEQNVISTIISTTFGLSQLEADALRQEAEDLETEAPDNIRFTRAIKSSVPYEQRERVIEAFWEVALADGVRDHSEHGFLRLVAKLLGVNDRDSALARNKVMSRLQ